MDDLEKVMTVKEVMLLYYLTRSSVDYAISRNLVRYRRSGGTYLILAEDAEKRWGKSKSWSGGSKHYA